MTTHLQDYYKTAMDDIDALVKIWQANVYLRGYALMEGAHVAEATAGSSEIPNDVGTQLADPIVQLDQALHNRADNWSPAAAPTRVSFNAPAAKRIAKPAAAEVAASAHPAPVAAPAVAQAPTPSPHAAPAPSPARATAAVAQVAKRSPPVAPAPSPAPAVAQAPPASAHFAPSPPIASPPAETEPVARRATRGIDGLPRSVSPPLPPVRGVPVTPSPILTGASFTPGEGHLSRAIYKTGAVGVKTSGLRPTALTSNDTASATGTPGMAAMAVYVWKSAELIGKQNDEKFWQGVQRIPINRLLLSLNSEQIDQAHAQPQALRGFLEAARRHGVAVELLLGDPSWIQAEHRAKLVSIIDALRGFNFAGLDLDIEPDQIYKEPLSQTQFNDWMDTLHAAARVSPWPTSVSMHPRYFRDAPYLGWDSIRRLREAGISQVTLMIYSSNPQHVADVAKPIVSKGTGLRFRIAQSVEPELQSNLSYARRSPQDFRQSMQQLQALLAAQPNTDGVVVQAWNDLMRMGYESQIR
jgi:hypothetical protein